MAERFEKSNNILCEDKIQKKACRGFEQVREAERSKKKPFLFKKKTRREYSSSLKVTNPINKMFIT